MKPGNMQRSGWEYFTIVCVVVSGILLSAALYAKRDQVFKERLRTLELMTHRNYVIAYTLEYRKHPPDLTGSGAPKTDPFGDPYQYDEKSGWVSSP